jgi:hypothetical protein
MEVLFKMPLTYTNDAHVNVNFVCIFCHGNGMAAATEYQGYPVTDFHIATHFITNADF